MPARKRIVFHVVPYRYGWRFTRDGRVTRPVFETKLAATRYVRGLCRALWARHRLAQMVVHKRDGEIEFESTYGLDPQRSKS